MLRYILGICIGLLAIFLPLKQSYATHAAGTDLLYECLGNGEYKFTLNFYYDCDGSATPPSSPDIPISSSCFNQTLTLSKDTFEPVEDPFCDPSLSSCNGGSFPGYEVHRYSNTITLDTTCSDYTASFEEINRNNAIDNIDTSANPSLFVDATFDPTICNSSPTFEIEPIPYVCAGTQENYNHDADDPDGDSLAYTLVTPLDGPSPGTQVSHIGPYSSTYPMPTQSGNFPFNNNTGQIGPFVPTIPPGLPNPNNFIAVVTVRVDQYRNGQKIGSIKRDMQYQVIDCGSNPNNPPKVDSLLNLQGGQLTSNNRIEMCPGDSLSFDIKSFDQDAGDTITMTSNINSFNLDKGNNASFDVTGNPTDTLTGTFSWVPQGVDTSDNVLVVRIEDDACPIKGDQIVTYNIFVRDGTFANPKDAAYCPVGGPIDINVVGGNQFSWKPDSGIVSASSDSSTIQVAPSAPTQYFVESDLTSSCKQRDTVFVDRVPDFIETVDPSPTDTICQGQNSPLQVLINPSDTVWSPYSYNWSPSSGLNNDTIRDPIASPEETTTYFVDVTSDTGCTIQDSVSVVVSGQAPTVDIQSPAGVCVEDTTQITAFTCQGEPLMDDFDPGIDNSMWSNIGSVAANGNCGSNSGGNALWFGNPTGTRQISTIDLVTTGGGTLDFYLKEGDGGTNCESPSASDEYMILEYSNNGGGSWTTINTYTAGNNQYTNFTLIQEPLPALAQTPSTRFRFRQFDYDSSNDHWAIDDVSYQCCGQGCANYTYNWTPGTGLSDSTIAEPDFFADTTRTYVVEVTPIGTNCTKSDTATIGVSPDFSYTVSDDDTICANQSTQLSVQGDTAQSPYSYNWSPAGSLNNDSIADPIASPTENTTYNVSITSQGGCRNEDSVSVNVSGNAPKVSITGNDVLCAGDTNQLNVEVCAGNALFDDFDSSIDSSMWSNIGSVAANSNCGSNSASNSLWFGTNTGTRQIATVDLVTNGGGTLDFYLKEGDGGTNCESPSASDEYMILEYSNNGGLSWNTMNTYTAGNNQYTSFTLIQEPIPAAAQTSSTRFRFRQFDYDSGNDQWAIDDVNYECCGSQCGNYTYNWTPGSKVSDSTIKNPEVFPDSSTTFVVGVTPQGTNCTNYDTIDVTVVPDFTYTTGPDDTICKFANTDLFAEGLDSTQAPYSYSWSPVGGLQDTNAVNAQAPTAEPDTTTTYNVQITSDSGCTNTGEQTVTVSGKAPRIDIRTSGNNVCPGDTVNIDGNIFQLECGPATTSCQTQPQIQQYGSSSSQSNATPFNGSSEDTRYQVLFRKAELANAGISAGTIVQLFLDVNTQSSNNPYENFTIKMGCTNDTELSTSGWQTGLTTVFTPKSITTNSGFSNLFTLDNPYNWDGTSNLVIEICYDNPTTNPPGGDDLLNRNAVSYNASMQTSSDEANGCSLPTAQAQTYNELPNIRFRICEPPTQNYTYNWTPTSGLLSPDSLNTDAIIDSSTTYELFVDDGQCTNTGEVTVNVDTSYDVVAKDTTLCAGASPDSVKLNASVIGTPPTPTLPCGANGTNCTTTPSTNQVGTGTQQPTDGANTPYYGFYHDQRIQFLYRASELQAQGISSGTITELAWNVISKNSTQPYNGFTIKMGCTNANSLPNNDFASTPLTTVYGPTTYTTSTGTNTHPLSNTFDWDGSSNIIIEVCFDNTSFTNEDVVLVENKSFNATAFAYEDGATGCNLTSSSFSFTTSTERPNIQFTSCPAPQGEENLQWFPANQVSNDTIADPWGYISGNSSEFVVSYTAVNGCTKYDTANVNINTNFNTTVSNDTTICRGDSVQLNASGDANKFSWSPDSSLSCSDCPDPVATPVTPTTYQVLLEDTVSGCTQSKSVNVNAVEQPPVSFLGSNPDSICPGRTYEVGVEDAYNSYQWDNGDTVPVTEIEVAGYHAVTVTGEAGCSNSDSIFLNTISNPQPAISPSTLNCSNGNFPDTLTLMQEFASYSWSTGDTSAQTVIDSNGTYSVTVTDTSGCLGTDEMNASINNVDVELSTESAEDTSLVKGESTTLTAEASNGVGPYTFEWQNDNSNEDVSNENGATINVTPQNSTTYEVTATDADNCVGTDTVFVEVLDEPDIVVPKAFSPNNDGRNEYIKPLVRGPVEIQSFKIFNRWGEKLFSMQGQGGNGWDGTYNGNNQPVGTYVYYLNYKQNGEEKQETGSISLVR